MTVMTGDARRALTRLLNAFENHFDIARDGDEADDAALEAAELALRDAFFTYDDILFTQLGVELPFDILDDSDEDDEDDDSDYEDDDSDFGNDDDDEDDDDGYSYSAPSYSYEEPSYSAPSYSGGGGASTAIATAQSYLGVPYVWGGESYGGVDCSGLTMLAWGSAGVDLPHLSRAQYSYGTHVPIGSMEAGDLIFWSSNGTQSGIYHVAIYLGGGQMIEAPTFGVPVRITGVYSWGSIMPYAVRL